MVQTDKIGCCSIHKNSMISFMLVEIVPEILPWSMQLVRSQRSNQLLAQTEICNNGLNMINPHDCQSYAKTSKSMQISLQCSQVAPKSLLPLSKRRVILLDKLKEPVRKVPSGILGKFRHILRQKKRALLSTRFMVGISCLRTCTSNRSTKRLALTV